MHVPSSHYGLFFLRSPPPYVADFEGGGCATLTDMYSIQKESGPLWVLDADDNIIDGGGGTPTGYWLLTMDLRVHDGVTLIMHGTSVGGDCDVLRIRSDEDGDGAYVSGYGGEHFHELRGHGGSLSFMNTKVGSMGGRGSGGGSAVSLWGQAFLFAGYHHYR